VVKKYDNKNANATQKKKEGTLETDANELDSPRILRVVEGYGISEPFSGEWHYQLLFLFITQGCTAAPIHLRSTDRRKKGLQALLRKKRP